jgi:type VI secretion system protein ImpM
MHTPRLGYYGKLPLSSEFIRCQASGAEIDELDLWLREGMYHAKSVLGTSWPTAFTQADTWSFLYLSPGRERLLMGLLRPSQDRAGREFPFLIYLIVNREEFIPNPGCAPLQFKEFFVQGDRVVTLIAAESDFNRLRFRLEALSPVEESETNSGQHEYQSLLRHRRSRDHWNDLFGEDGQKQSDQLFRHLLHAAGAPDTNRLRRFPLFQLSKEETYDLPFWIDVMAYVSGRQFDTGMLLWNRNPSKVKPVLIVSGKLPTPELLLEVIHPERSQDGTEAVAAPIEELTDAQRALLEDGDVTVEAFLHKLSNCRL